MTTAFIETQQGGAEPISSEEFKAIYGDFIRASAFEFKDGRFVQLEEFERAYVLRCVNPKYDPPAHLTFLTLSREAMYGFHSLYILARLASGLGRDETALREHLIPEHLANFDEIINELRSEEKK